MKRGIAVCFLVAVCTVYGSSYPRQAIVSQDGCIEIVDFPGEEYSVPGVMAYVNGGSYAIPLETPANFTGTASAMAGSGDIICGTVFEWDGSVPAVVKAVAWRNSNPHDTAPEFLLSELCVLPGARSSNADNISENGRYIIGSCSMTSYNVPQACYWDEHGNVHSLGTLTYDSVEAIVTQAFSVSNNNLIVGMASNYLAGYQAAFIWDQEHGMRYVKDVLEADYGYDFSGCVLSCAYNVTPDGTMIDGYGYDAQGDYFDWAVTIPEPTSVLLLAVGGLVLRRKSMR